MRRHNLAALEKILELSDARLYQNKAVVKTAKSVLRLLHRVGKNREAELAKFEPQLETYLASDEYKTFTEKMKSKTDDEDEYKADHDPKGYFAYQKLVS